MIFIPGNVPSSKNSKVAATVGKGQNAKTVLLHSKTVKKYLRNLGIQRFSAKTGITGYVTRPNLFKRDVGGYFDDVEYPCVLGFNFVRDSLRKFDFINACQIICDLLAAHGYINDDDMKHLIPMPMMINGSWYSVCKDKPGVWLKIIKGRIDPLMFDQYF
jgi:hypothetical protein